MMDTGAKILQWLSAVAVAVGFFFHNMPVVFQVLIVFMVLDTIAGFLRALTQQKISAEAAYRGMIKKGGMLILVGMLVFLQKITGMTGVPLPEALASFYIYVEGLSILENASAFGVPIPQFLRDALEALSPEKVPPPAEEPKSIPAKV